MTKSKSKRDARRKSDGLKPKQGTKRHAGRKQSKPLVPEPTELTDLLTLVNLLPHNFDHPYKHDIVYWNPDSSSSELYRKLLWLLDGLPIELQAYVFRDGQGEVSEFGPIQSGEWIELERNFAVLHVAKPELEAIVQDTKNRILRAMELESRSPVTHLDAFHSETVKIAGGEYFVWSSSELISRARNRLLFLFAARETLSALPKPDAWLRVLRLNDSPLSVGAHARIYIAQSGEDKGKLVVHSPVLYKRLEGIEAARIRECPICARIFWAGRKDKFCCSDKCLAAQRSREYRKAYKEKCDLQRSNQRQLKALTSEQGKTSSQKGKKSA